MRRSLTKSPVLDWADKKQRVAVETAIKIQEFIPDYVIKPTNSTQPSVILEWNLGRYLQVLRSGNDNLIKKVFNEFSTYLGSLPGELIWEDIVRALSLSFLKNDNHSIPFKTWQTIEKSSLFEMLNSHNIEIIKNAIDAYIKENISKPLELQEIKLSMTFQLFIAMDEDFINLKIYDNSGGFSEKTLQKYNKVTLAQLTQKTPSDKNENANVPFLGGAGLGLRQLCAEVKYGQTLKKNGALCLKYDVKDVTGANIILENYPSNEHPQGALISISAPIKPIPRLPTMNSTCNMLRVLQMEKDKHNQSSSNLLKTKEEDKVLSPRTAEDNNSNPSLVALRQKKICSVSTYESDIDDDVENALPVPGVFL